VYRGKTLPTDVNAWAFVLNLYIVKILGMYFDTLIIDRKLAVSILNELTLQNELQNVMLIMIFGEKHTKYNNNIKIGNIKILSSSGNWTWDLSHPSLVCNLLATETTERVD